MKVLRVVAPLLISFTCLHAKNPIEVGEVNWGRNYQRALEQAKQSGKPVFLLFQEVPGCSGCKQFGQDVLSDPKVVETIETNFVPLLIHNNKPGEDARIREKYSEPAWNYQVVRFLDENGRDIIPRKDRVWSSQELMERIQTVLTKTKPSSIEQIANAAIERVAFSQFCFWTGERKLGAMTGVLTTEAGFIDGHEVTLVTYDPTEVSLETLAQQAVDAGVASSIYLDDPSRINGSRTIAEYRRAPESDQKRQLQGTPFQKLDLTPEQATKLNALARSDFQAALEYLTPAKLSQLKKEIQ